MKHTTSYATAVPTLFLLAGLFLFPNLVPQTTSTEQPPSTPPVSPSSPSSPATPFEESGREQEDYALEITHLDEDFILHFLIHNHSEEELVYGMHYSLSKLEGETWIPVDLDMAFIEIACLLPPKESAEESVYLQDFMTPLSSGTYRLEKILNGISYEETFSID